MTIQSIYAVIKSAQTLRVLFPFVFQVNWPKNKKYVQCHVNQRERIINWLGEPMGYTH